LILYAVALKVDGSLQYDVEMKVPAADAKGVGRKAARKLLEQGADKLMDEIRS